MPEWTALGTKSRTSVALVRVGGMDADGLDATVVACPPQPPRTSAAARSASAAPGGRLPVPPTVPTMTHDEAVYAGPWRSAAAFRPVVKGHPFESVARCIA